MDEVFKALADTSRRRLLDELNRRDGQTLRALCADLDMTRQSVSKHLMVLEAAGLVTTVRRGREKLHHLNTEPITALSERWITQYHRAPAPPVADLTAAAETGPAEARAFVYTIYIRTTPERLWQALTEPAYSRRHLGHALTSTWEKGATYTWAEDGFDVADPDQVVLEADPYRRLAIRFPTFPPELAGAYPWLSAEAVAQAAAEPRSRVSFDMGTTEGQVTLTLVHDDLGPDSAVRELVAQLWPRKLSDLKSGLELEAG